MKFGMDAFQLHVNMQSDWDVLHRGMSVLTYRCRGQGSISVWQNLPVGVSSQISSHTIHTLKEITKVRILSHSEAVDKDILVDICTFAEMIFNQNM